jgi:protein-L-isoaspartate(D-aspartate) O-methyltransferase
VLHVGAGLGYYSAIIGHVVGATGSVVAVEIDEVLAARAQSNVAAMPWVSVQYADATGVAGPFDAILVHAGVTHPLDAWLDALAPGGRLLLPLTVEMPAMGATLGKGVVVIVSRTEDGADFRAEVQSFVAIYSAIGLRDAEIGARLEQALRRTSFPNLAQLRRDQHDSTPACWLHGRGFCLSMEPVS